MALCYQIFVEKSRVQGWMLALGHYSLEWNMGERAHAGGAMGAYLKLLVTNMRRPTGIMMGERITIPESNETSSGGCWPSSTFLKIVLLFCLGIFRCGVGIRGTFSGVIHILPPPPPPPGYTPPTFYSLDNHPLRLLAPRPYSHPIPPHP